MKTITEHLKISAAILFFAVSLAAACTTSEKSDAAVYEKSDNGKAGESAAPTAATPKKEETKQADIFADFKKGADYKTDIRPKLIKDGWKTARTTEGDENCASGSSLCGEFPELEAGPAAGLGNIIFRWEKDGRVLKIYTVDSPPIYQNHELEKPAPKQTSTAAEISGKYLHRYTEDYGGEISFDFKSDKKVAFQWMQEDVAWKGNGTWVWNEAAKTLTATVFVEPDDEFAAPNEKAAARKEVYVFSRSGANLKLINTPPNMEFYKNRLFKKQ